QPAFRAVPGVVRAVVRAWRRAGPGVPRARRRAWPGLVVPAPAAVRVVAAVLPGEPLELRPDAHLAALAVRLVDVEGPPPQPERLALPQAARQPGGPPGELAAFPCHREHGAGLAAGERGAVGFAEFGRLDLPARVPGDVLPLDLDLVGGG